MNKIAIEPLATSVPNKFRLTETAEKLRISWRWLQADAIVLLLVCLGWNGCLVGMYRAIVSGGLGVGSGDAFLPLLIASGHAMVGLYLAYYALASVCNRTTLTFVGDVRPLEGGTYRSTSSKRSGILTVRHGPLPWPGNVSLQAAEIVQVVLAKRERRRKSDAVESFDIVAVDRRHRERVVVTGLEAGEAAFVYGRLCRVMGLDGLR